MIRLKLGHSSKRVVVSFLAAALVLAACGDQDEQEATAAGEDEGTGEGEDGADWPDELIFGTVPTEEGEGLTESWEPILLAVGDRLGIEIEMQAASDYASVAEAQIAERVDFAYYGAFGYVAARMAGAEIDSVVAPTMDPGEGAGYETQLIAQAGRDDINDITDVAGMDICMVDPTSTSGGVYPHGMLMDAGIDPDEDIRGTYTGGHDSSVLAVLQGDCDAGFAFDGMIHDILPRDGYYEIEELKIVASALVPGPAIAVGNWLPQDLIDAIQDAFVEITAETLVDEGYCPDGQAIESKGEGELMCPIGGGEFWGAEAVDDSYYEEARTICRETNAPACDLDN